MNVQIKVVNIPPDARDETAHLIVYAANGEVYDEVFAVVNQGNGQVVANAVVPNGGYITMTKFVPASVYDPDQRASVPGDQP